MTLRRDKSDLLGLFDRPRARKHFRQWAHGSDARPLLITGPSSSGKTCLVKLICAAEPGLTAVVYCNRYVPETYESATLIRSLCQQISSRHPNLGLPILDTVTLLVDASGSLILSEGALEHCLLRPLEHLQRPSTSAEVEYLILDDIRPEIVSIVFQLAQHLPRWLRLTITVTDGSLDAKTIAQLESQCEIIRLNGFVDELRDFVQDRFRKVTKSEVDCIAKACNGSWFYVEQLAAARRMGLLMDAQYPDMDTLLSILESHFTKQSSLLPVLLQLIAASRRPPSQKDIVSALHRADCRFTAGRFATDLENFGDLILESRDPMRLRAEWMERELSNECKQDAAHAMWANALRLRCDNNDETLIELAYHLGHCKADQYPNRVEILRDLDAGDLILKCAVIDWSTTQLLMEAGAVVTTDPLQDDLIYLCSSGDSNRIVDLLPTASVMDLNDALITAASRGHTKICNLILRKAPECLFFVDEHQWTALRAAACHNQIDVVDTLIANGAQIDHCGLEGRTALRAASWSGHVEVVEHLLEAGANVDRVDCEGRSALMAAAFMGHSKIAKILLDSCADPNLTDLSGRSALHLAVSNESLRLQDTDMVNILLHAGAEVDQPDNARQTPLHMAAHFGFTKAITNFCSRVSNIDQPDELGRSPLMLAACEGHLKAMQLLIEAGADIDSIDSHGRTALTHAAIFGHLPVVQMLLQLGADEVHKDNEGAIPLHYACVHEEVELCQALTASNTLYETDRYGLHALLIAAQNGNSEVVTFLLESGAPIRLQSLDGLSAFRAAALAGHEEVMRIFLKYSTFDVLEPADFEASPLLHNVLLNCDSLSIAKCLLEIGAPIGARDLHGRTALHVVAATNGVLTATLLLDHGIDLEARDEDGRTALMVAAWFGHLQVAHFLLEAGAMPNAQDNQGASALSIASQLGNRDLVVLLLKFGAEPSLCDFAGRTAIDVAIAGGHEHVQAILKSANGSADSSGFGSMPQTPDSIIKRCISSSLRRTGIATNPKIRDCTLTNGNKRSSPLTSPSSIKGFSLPRGIL